MGKNLLLRSGLLAVMLCVCTAYRPWDSVSDHMRRIKEQFDHDFHDPVYSLESETEFPEAVIVDKPSKSFFPFFSMPRIHTISVDVPKAWWKGPNVCEERETIEGSGDGSDKNDFADPDSFNSFAKATSCRSSNTLHVCTTRIFDEDGERRVIVRHRCCPGYKRDRHGAGCIKILNLTIYEVLKENNATRFYDLAQLEANKDLLNTPNITLFCPTDQAIIRYEEMHTDNFISSEKSERQSLSKDESDMVANHIVNDYLLSEELDYDIPNLLTASNKSKIRINKYYNPYKVLTANCVPIISVDHLTQSSVVHIVEQVIPTPTKTLAQLIQNDPELSIWREILKVHNLLDQLGDPKTNFTVFAPVNKAFENQSEAQMGKLRSGDSCLGSIVKSHLVEGIVCASVLKNDWHLNTMLNNEIILKRNSEDKLQIDENNDVTKSDIMATNGVLHVVNNLIIPDEAKSAIRMLKDQHFDEFVKLIDEAGLTEELDSLNNFTIFIPTENALKKSKVGEIKDKNALKELIRHHILLEKLPTSKMGNGQKLTTSLGDALLNIGVKNLFPHRPMIFIDCGVITEPNIGVCGGEVHVIDKVLVPLKHTLMESVNELENADKFLKLLKFSGLESLLKDTNNTYTVLIPTDQAFRRLSPRYQHMLENDKAWAKRVVKMHIFPGRICSSLPSDGYMIFSSLPKKTIDGHTVQLTKDHLGLTKFGSARVVRSDLQASNGVIQIINKVIAPPTHRFPFHFADQIFNMFL